MAYSNSTPTPILYLSTMCTGKQINIAILIIFYNIHKISFESYQFVKVFQEFQNISGQDIVDAINECYDGYFQELLVAVGK